jgi:hypothetical protein
VVIPSDMPHYPELTDSAWCNLITVQDRAMLANPHVLNYNSAQVELKLKATERDRFIMWSAPLLNMYSGDYHFKDGSGAPRWGDVYMNFFQQDNPHGGAAQRNTFTATFGELNVPLSLGRAFNLQVTSTSESRSLPLIFPQTDPSSWLGMTPPARHRFITDSVEPGGADRTFPLDVMPKTGNEFYDLIQVVNPYIAWLDVIKFLNGNQNDLGPGYLFWNGSFDDGFEAVAVDGNRYVWSTRPSPSQSPLLIPPLQSFFVQKRNTGLLPSVNMSPNWTTTVNPGVQSYVLRSGASESGVLRIRASQGSRTAYALLRHEPQAVPEYSSREDIRPLFYDALPLTLYTLTALGEPLLINADGSFALHETALGLRLAEAGQTVLSFTGLETFGHNVFLIDRERDNLQIDLQQTPEYTFTAIRPPGTTVFELNDRFVLRMEYTGRGLGTAETVSPEALFSGENGRIRVRSLSGELRRIEVYNMPGMPVYVSNTPSTEYSIPTPPGIYLVKVQAGKRVMVEKVVVR